MNSPNTFCPLPWVHQAIRNNGDVRVCCQANVTPNQGILRKDDGSSYNASRDNLSEAKNVIMIKEIRKNMLSGTWSDECARCKSEEDAGIASRRLNELDQWQFSLQDALECTSDDGSINLETKYFDLRFGNICNLACRMCGPTDSHSWYEEWTEFNKTDGFEDTHGYVKLVKNDNGRWMSDQYSWHESKKFWEQMEYKIPFIEHVYMAGGEPLIISQHTYFLERCIELNRADKIVLEYNTNITVLPARVLELWKQFKQVRIGASVDGFGEMQEYQRWPIKWTHTLKNLQKLDTIARENTNILPHIALTVTAYNAFHLPEFIWWKLMDSKFQKINSMARRPVITHHMAHKPYKMSVQMYPESIRNKLTKSYDSWIKKFNDSTLPDNVKEASVNILKSVLMFMQLENHSEVIKEFVDLTVYLDNKRNQDIKALVPELGELFEE